MATRLSPWILLCSLAAPRLVHAQSSSAADAVRVTGSVTVTTKGISTIPSFTLGRPAATVDVVIRKRALSAEPQLRTGLDGKPWAFLFWIRHRPVNRGRFQLLLGTHPAYAFRTSTVTTTGGTTSDILEVRRYLASEIAPTVRVASHLTVGSYYLYSRGFDPGAARHTHYVAARATITNLPLSERTTLQIAPQFYYLSTGGEDGTYANLGVTLARRNLPVSLSATVNKPIRTTVAGGREVLWNVSVVYAMQ